MSGQDAYITNTTPAAIVERIRAAQRVAIATHRKPDGDAVGSTLGLVRACIHAGKHAVAVFPDPWSRRFDAMLDGTPAVHAPESLDDAPDLPFTPDVVVCVDTGSWSQLAQLRGWLTTLGPKHVIVIDHHPAGDAAISDARWIETDAAANAALVARLVIDLLGVRSAADLPVEIAEPLYLGIATDTGWFRYSNLRPQTHRLAADLLDAGVDHNRLLRISDQSDPPQRVRLLARALSSLELLHEGQIGVATIRQSDLDAAGAELGESGGLSDPILAIETVRATAVLTETPTGGKVSLRSKPPATRHERDVDVNIVAQALGGGGHKRAAGARYDMTVEDAKKVVVDAIARQLR